MSNSLEELRNRYSAVEAEKLFAIVHTDSDQYRPEAVLIAQEELARRGIPQGGTAELRQNAEREKQERLAYEEMPLSTRQKLILVLLLGMPALRTYAIMEIEGRQRAAREAIEWALKGLGFWLLLALGVWFLLGFVFGLTS